MVFENRMENLDSIAVVVLLSAILDAADDITPSRDFAEVSH